MKRQLQWRRPQMRDRQRGVTLIELMVALAIGAFLMLGAVTVFMQSRTTFRITESVSRLQENGRFALDVLEADVRMSHFWGLTNLTYAIEGRRLATEPHWAPGPAACGVNWAINLENQVGSNNAYGWTCAPSGAFQAGSDTLIVRRVAEDPIANPTAGGALNNAGLYVQSSRPGGAPNRIFLGNTVGAIGFNPAVHAVHRLMANGYYVDQRSALGATVPSLRMKTLLENGTIVDSEVMPYIEDLQVQYGVDTDPVDTPNRGAVDRYVNAGDPIITPGAAGYVPFAEILAVRVWLRVRAERPENGFVDSTNYVYADRNVGPFNDNFRRIVVSKTIYLRNARPLS